MITRAALMLNINKIVQYYLKRNYVLNFALLNQIRLHIHKFLILRLTEIADHEPVFMLQVIAPVPNMIKITVYQYDEHLVVHQDDFTININGKLFTLR